MSGFDITQAQSAKDLTRFAMTQKLLEKEEEQALAEAWINHKDKKAMNKLITSHMRLVVVQALKFRHYGLQMADLLQEGNIGLLHAVNRFDTERDVRFSTYAGWWIKSCLQDFVLRNWSIVRTGTTSSQKALFFHLRHLRAKIEKSSAEDLNYEGRQKIASTLNVKVSDVEGMENRINGSDHSLNAEISDEGEGGSWQDLLADSRPTPEESSTDFDLGQKRKAFIAQSMQNLSTREKQIIAARCLSDKATTLEDLGKALGVSKERVRQLEAKALEKMKASLQKLTGNRPSLLLQ